MALAHPHVRVHTGIDEHQSVSSWFRSLSPEKRAAIRRLHRIRPAYNWTMLGHLLLWAGAGFTMHHVAVWPLRFAGYVFIGFTLHGLGSLMHEGIHGNLFRKPRYDRCLGFALGACVFVSAAAYRVIHVRHHRYNRGDDDPDEITNVVSRPIPLLLASYAWLVVGTYVYVLLLPWKAVQHACPRDRRRVLGEYTLLSVAYATLCLCALRFGFWAGVLHYWVIPSIITALFANLRSWAEHMHTRPGHPLTQSRTITSNKLLSFLNVNLNYHLEHHLFPAIPWYNLPKVHQLLQAEYRQAGAFIHASYLRFLYDAVRVGTTGVVR